MFSLVGAGSGVAVSGSGGAAGTVPTAAAVRLSATNVATSSVGPAGSFVGVEKGRLQAREASSRVSRAIIFDMGSSVYKNDNMDGLFGNLRGKTPQNAVFFMEISENPWMSSATRFRYNLLQGERIDERKIWQVSGTDHGF
jgi:hypothetical protein